MRSESKPQYEEDKPKVLLIVPTDQYLTSHGSQSFEELVKSDTDFNSDNLPEYDIFEWKDKAIRSGSFEIKEYVELAKQISARYLDYDGFVVIDAIQTIPYTASYLSFMFENLAKPIILTGSYSNSINQIFSDAKSNLLHSIIIAGHTQICEVVVCFNKKIYRGNRIQRKDINHDPFITYNCPQLGEFANTNLTLSKHCMSGTVKKRFKTFTKLFTNIIVIHLIPQLTDSTLKILLFSQLSRKRKKSTKSRQNSIELTSSKSSLSLMTNTTSHRNKSSRSASNPSTPNNNNNKFKRSISPSRQLNFEQSSTQSARFGANIYDGTDNILSPTALYNEHQRSLSPKFAPRDNHNISNMRLNSDDENKGIESDMDDDDTPEPAKLNRVKSINRRDHHKKSKNHSHKTLKAVILSFFGVGNAPTRQSFKDVLKTAIDEYECEIIITCQGIVGGCDSSVYASGNFLSDLNLISAMDMTTECCVAKLSYLMGKGYRGSQLKEQFETNLRGELTEIQEKKRRIVQHIPMDNLDDEDDGSSDSQ